MLNETEAAASFHGLCHFFGRLSKASRANDGRHPRRPINEQEVTKNTGAGTQFIACLPQ